jgi:hypothetical protein
MLNLKIRKFQSSLIRMIQSMYQESTFQGIRFVQFIAQQSNLSWNFLLLDEKMLSDKLKFYSYVIRTQTFKYPIKVVRCFFCTWPLYRTVRVCYCCCSYLDCCCKVKKNMRRGRGLFRSSPKADSHWPQSQEPETKIHQVTLSVTLFPTTVAVWRLVAQQLPFSLS